MKVKLLLAPYDTARRGWRMGAGPEHLMSRGLAERLAAGGHRVSAATLDADDGQEPAEVRTAFVLMHRLAVGVREALAAGEFPLVLAGNCSSAVGTLAGLGAGRRAVFWFDAHGDFNTPETTTTGFLDGMALAIATGGCWRELAATVPGFAPIAEERVLLLGARELDPLEASRLAASALQVLPPPALATSLAPALRRVATSADGAYLHCDLDVLDPQEGRANPFAVAGGLRLDALVEAIAAIGRAAPVRAAAITAYAPELDRDGRVCRAAFALAEALAGAGRG
jgi:arginase